MKDRCRELILNSFLCREMRGEERTGVHKATEKNSEGKESHEKEQRVHKRVCWKHGQGRNSACHLQ